MASASDLVFLVPPLRRRWRGGRGTDLRRERDHDQGPLLRPRAVPARLAAAGSARSSPVPSPNGSPPPQRRRWPRRHHRRKRARACRRPRRPRAWPAPRSGRPGAAGPTAGAICAVASSAPVTRRARPGRSAFAELEQPVADRNVTVEAVDRARRGGGCRSRVGVRSGERRSRSSGGNARDGPGPAVSRPRPRARRRTPSGAARDRRTSRRSRPRASSRPARRRRGSPPCDTPSARGRDQPQTWLGSSPQP